MQNSLIARYAAIVAVFVVFPLVDLAAWAGQQSTTWWLYLAAYPAAFLGTYVFLGVFADDLSAHRRRSGIMG